MFSKFSNIMLLTFWNQSIIIGCGLRVGKCNLKIQDLFDIRKNIGHRSVCMGGEWKPSFGFGPWFNFIVGGKTH